MVQVKLKSLTALSAFCVALATSMAVCAPEAFADEPPDAIGGGVADVFDIDGDGVADMLDINDDGIPDVKDLDHNGKADSATELKDKMEELGGFVGVVLESDEGPVQILVEIPAQEQGDPQPAGDEPGEGDEPPTTDPPTTDPATKDPTTTDPAALTEDATLTAPTSAPAGEKAAEGASVPQEGSAPSGAGQEPRAALRLVEQASGSVVASGTWGECPWQLDSDGVLTVFAGTGSDSLTDALGEHVGSVKSIKFSGNVVAPKNCSGLFRKFNNVQTIDLQGLNTANATNMFAMFANCSSLKTVNMDKLDLKQVEDMGVLFYGCSALESIDLSNLALAKLTNLRAPFFGCSALKNVNMSGAQMPCMEDLRALFLGCSALENANLSNLVLPVLENMNALFFNCTNLVSADLSGVKTPKLKNTGALFFNCESLKSANLSGFDTSAVTQMGAMFSGCKSVEFLDLSKLDTSSVRNMFAMFNGCTSLRALDISHFNTAATRDMGGMFFGNESLKDVDVSSFDTSGVRNMIAMFANCTDMRVLDISNFDTSNVPDLQVSSGWLFETLKSAGERLNLLDKISIPTESVLEIELTNINNLLEILGLAPLPMVRIDVPRLDINSEENAGGMSFMFSNDIMLERVTLGAKTKPLGLLPSFPLYGHSDWRSENEDAWFTSREINDSRLGIRDTYVKYPNDRTPINLDGLGGNARRAPAYLGSARSTMARTGDGLGIYTILETIALGLAALALKVAHAAGRRRQ